ncbi:hypothetical protein HYT58_00800 [Candidatus Woesearchaeota archaeon]|nr:hypothetical protein [Candidatus Woesearchaeota archaeon]
MERLIKDKSILEKFAEAFVSVVEKHCKYAVVSGFLIIMHGRSRGTEDIDIILDRLNEEELIRLHNDLEKHGFVCVQTNDVKEIYDYLINNTSVRYVKKDNPLPEMEVRLVKDKLDDYQIKTRKKLPLTGLSLYFSSVEMNLAFKEDLLKSDKDLEDARYLREVYKGKVDEFEVNKIKRMIKRFKLK